MKQAIFLLVFWHVMGQMLPHMHQGCFVVYCRGWQKRVSLLCITQVLALLHAGSRRESSNGAGAS